MKKQHDLRRAAEKLQFILDGPVGMSPHTMIFAVTFLHAVDWTLEEKHCTCREPECTSDLDDLLASIDAYLHDVQCKLERDYELTQS